MKKNTKYMFPTEDLMHSFNVHKKVNISKNIKELIDKKLDRLFSSKRETDPALGEELTYWQYWLHTATIKHGQILEEVVMEIVRNKLQNCIVWEEKKFKVTQRSLNIAADPQSDILNIKMPYPNRAKKTIQIDMFIYNPKNFSFNSYEIKRGHGTHDRQKKEKMVADLLTTHMHMDDYAKKEKKIKVDTIGSYVISVFGKELLSPEWQKFSINGFKEIDKHFKTNISTDIVNSNNYFRDQLILNANKKTSK